MKIYFGGDHAGFEMKKELIDFAHSLGHEVEDLGPFSYDAGDDYPDYVIPLAKRVAETPHPPAPSPMGREGGGVVGIVVAGSGQGEAMCANRFSGARAAVYYGPSTALGASGLEVVRLSREHNNANILSLGARFCTNEQAKEAVKIFLDTPFSSDERHMRRIKKIEQCK